MSESRVKTLTTEVAALEKTMGDLQKKEGDLLKKQTQLAKALSAAKTTSTLQSKTREYDRLLSSLAELRKKQSATLKRQAAKEEDLGRARAALNATREKERKRMAAQVERQRNEQLKKEREFQRQMSELLTPSQALMTASTEETKPHDFFISHASEDKDEVARPLYEALTAMGCEVWYDEFSLQLGDSLMRKINKGIAASRYGVVILSKKFLDKEWPQLELAALNAIEVRGVKKILPIWHHLTYDELLARAPMLADRVAADTSRKTIEEIAKQLKGMLD